MTNQLINLGLTEKNGKIVVSSRDIANAFTKEHARVMRDIRELKVSEEFRLGNFAESSYLNEQGKQQPEMLVTRDGFTILAMGYTGETAMEFKEAYINAFNEMERKFHSPQNYLEALKAAVVAEELRLALVVQNERLQLTAAKYEGQTNTAGLYLTTDLAKEYGVSARVLNSFLCENRIQYRQNLPRGYKYNLFAEYANSGYAVSKIIPANGLDIPTLLWTAKGRDFIDDLIDIKMPQWA
jgi:Rha family phage regulatory protein